MDDFRLQGGLVVYFAPAALKKRELKEETDCYFLWLRDGICDATSRKLPSVRIPFNCTQVFGDKILVIYVGCVLAVAKAYFAVG